MSEEEKKAIELLKNKNTEYYYRFIDVRDAVSTLLNLIENQQKEIEDIKEEYKNEQLAELKELNNYISKDKIREKIKKCKEMEKDFEFIDNKSYARDFNRDLIKAYEELLKEK